MFQLLTVLSFGNRTQNSGWLVQDPTTRPIGDLIPTIGRGDLEPTHGEAGRGGGRRGSVRVLLLAVRGIITDPNFSAEFFDGGLVPHGRVGANRNRREGGWTFMKIKCEKCVPAPGIVPWP